MNNKKDYKEALLNGASQNNIDNNNGYSSQPMNDNDYYNALKSESYRTLLKSEVQASNARDQALKYTQNSLNASGLGTQGVSESVNTGIHGRYVNALKSAQETHSNNLLNIANEQRLANKEKMNSDFESLASLMSGATDSSQMANIMTNYGIKVDDKGRLSGDYYNNLDDSSQRQLSTLYNLYNSQLEANDWLKSYTINGQGFKDAGAAMQNVVTSTGGMATDISKEMQLIFNDSYLKNVTEGHTVKLMHGHNENNFVYMIYSNGAWYQTTSDVFNNAENKDFIKDGKIL